MLTAAFNKSWNRNIFMAVHTIVSGHEHVQHACRHHLRPQIEHLELEQQVAFCWQALVGPSSSIPATCHWPQLKHILINSILVACPRRSRSFYLSDWTGEVIAKLDQAIFEGVAWAYARLESQPAVPSHLATQLQDPAHALEGQASEGTPQDVATTVAYSSACSLKLKNWYAALRLIAAIRQRGVLTLRQQPAWAAVP